jgi:hypothetical protein
VETGYSNSLVNAPEEITYEAKAGGLVKEIKKRFDDFCNVQNK